MTIDLSNQTVLITGASKGIGALRLRLCMAWGQCRVDGAWAGIGCCRPSWAVQLAITGDG